MKAVLLVGGLGTRLRSAVPSLPKALASVGDKPFLEFLVSQLVNQGICELVFCTGYLAEQIRDTFQDGKALGATIEYSHESSPMGTAGALKLAQDYLQGESEFVAINGDSLLEIDFAEFIACHREHGGPATMATVHVDDSSRYGTVQVGPDQRIERFLEKTGKSLPGLVNAGVYVFNTSTLDMIPQRPSSLELDIFPLFMEQGFYAVEQGGVFIDIGTPNDYAHAQRMYERLSATAAQRYASNSAANTL